VFARGDDGEATLLWKGQAREAFRTPKALLGAIKSGKLWPKPMR